MLDLFRWLPSLLVILRNVNTPMKFNEDEEMIVAVNAIYAIA